MNNERNNGKLKKKKLVRSCPGQSLEDNTVGNIKIRHGRTRGGERSKNITAPGCGEKNIALADLVAIFTEEAYKICKNRRIAKLIALKSLQEYVSRNTNHIKIVL